MGEQAVRNTIDHYFSSLNAKDLQGVSVACHFPHFRVMGNNTVYEWKSADDLFTWFQNHVSDDRWGYSELTEMSLEKFSDQKYHASLKFGRYQADGTLISY